MTDEYPYNDDLLILELDRDHVRAVYPSVADALIFPALGSVVQGADLKANAGKKAVWDKGFSAVVCVTISLLLASATPLYAEAHPYSELSAIAAAILGIFGAVRGIFNHQTEWMEHRLVTELTRQFHFRYMIESADQIVASADNGDFTEYLAKREIALAQFCKDIVDRKSGVLSAIIEDSESPKEVIGSLPPPEIFESTNGNILLLAYRDLRIARQRDYAQHKLSKKGILLSKYPSDQVQTIKYSSIILLSFLLLVHIGSALFITLRHEDFNKWLDFIGISIALLALALRAMEEGLKPKAEIERYRHYKAVTRRTLEEFDKGDVRSKLEAVKTLESAAYDELCIFLKAHEEAGFKM